MVQIRLYTRIVASAPFIRVVGTRGYASESPIPLKRTALYDFHMSHGAKMVPFAGWEMPVQYTKLGVLASHLHTREKASVFDVSHMLQTRWSGKDCLKFLEHLVVADLKALPVSASTLSLFTNERGGIVDDTVINKQTEDTFYVVSNAGCAEKDMAHILKELKGTANGWDVNVEVLSDASLIALQGPKAVDVLQGLVKEDLSSMGFMTSRFMDIKNIQTYTSRCGYTGEDGFEISVKSQDVTSLCEVLMGDPNVELAGLGARDSLRLEASLCLYGHDLNDDISPVEGCLTWTIGQRRRKEGGFIGADKILPQVVDAKLAPRRRIGLLVEGAPAREGAPILDLGGEQIGTVTSGCPSPVLKKNIAMGYVKPGNQKIGNELRVEVRGRFQAAVVTKMPFVPHRYFRKI
ncbi:aminomethyltransferase [Synchytrium endobioticum]|uniref:Aminomethyltransferase n=1 Tax=Synchytrium endobioticum TaxID=286115 RepID=A0A507D5E2_9FUNG|nr:aminomethyltransferase [Synchytrium endobioticum]TPX49569.1 aminomethyltransferase [Synchytrium endobioticum]